MISVIIINYNYGRFVGQAIESVLNQTYTDYEMIVIDGNSTDNSREVIKKYANEYPDKIKAIYKETSGQASAINRAFEKCNGDIVAFLDADDYFLENKLETISEYHEKYDFIGNARRFVGEKIIDRDYISPNDVEENRMELFHKYGYFYGYNLVTSTISLKKSLLEKILPMPEDNYITYADLYIKVFSQYYTNLKYINDILTCYRIHESQKNNSFNSISEKYEFIKEKYNQIFKDINDELEKRGEERIPQLDNSNLVKALNIANPEFKIKKDEKYAIYGAGENAYKLKRIIHSIGGDVVYLSDSNENLWGSDWNGIELISPYQLVKKREEYSKIIIGSFGYYKEISQILIDLGLEWNKDFCVPSSIPND